MVELQSNSLTLVNNNLVGLQDAIEALSLEIGDVNNSIVSLTTYLTSIKNAVNALKLTQQFAAKATITVSPNVLLASQKILAANPNRLGVIGYNNSANSGYVAYGVAANSSTSMTRIVATFAQFVMETPIFTGDLYAVRNAGSGTFLMTELTAI